MLLDAPPVVLERIQALGKGDLFAFQVLHPEDVIAGTHGHAAALEDPCCTQHPGATHVGVHLDGWIEATEADQVIQVVDVMRVPVILAAAAEIGVINADRLEVRLAPSEFLVDVIG